jgi:c-di-GMP-binding flagellar brake protein YcgR
MERQNPCHVRVTTDRMVSVRLIDLVTGEPAADSLPAAVRDISAGGALLVMAEPVSGGRGVLVEVVWTDPALMASLRGRVVRVAERDEDVEVSVEFEHADWTPRLEIVRWVLNEARRTNQMSGRVS